MDAGFLITGSDRLLPTVTSSFWGHVTLFLRGAMVTDSGTAWLKWNEVEERVIASA